MIDSNKESLIKRIFLQVVHEPKDKRESTIKKLSAGNTEIINAVKELLQEHLTAENSTTASFANEAITQEFSFPVQQIKKKFANLLSNAFNTENKFRLAVFVCFIFLCGLGYWTYNSIKTTLKTDKISELETIINSDALALHYWVEDMERDVESYAHQRNIKTLISDLVVKHPDTVVKDSINRELQEFLQPFMESNYAFGYALINKEGEVISTKNRKDIGQKISKKAISFFAEVFNGKTTFSRPSVSTEWLNVEPSSHEKRPIIWFNTPVHSNNGSEIIASLGLGVFADKDFSKILSLAQLGRSGETYAFSKDGYMLSESRFYQEIKETGILLDSATHSAMLNVRLRNPGVDVTKTKLIPEELEKQPFVQIYKDALENITNESQPIYHHSVLEPYTDYRGVKVIGSWIWIPEYDFGLITEVAATEAYDVLHVLSFAFMIIFSILALFVGYAMLSSYSIIKLNKHIDENRTLGQYTLLKKIGEGGMGVVYLAKHNFLKRPTVVKILKGNIANKTNISRFQKEVQLASQLTHPNTIKIYDYGVTPNNTFYYVMEHLQGFNLAELVKIEHQLPYERVVHFLKQICYSLREAHAQGIIHRDIKPMNIMTCYIGREYDVIKVLDFGLVKDINNKREQEKSAINQITGTPQYMAPERIEQQDTASASCDIYSLGAVCYNLLTGKKLFLEADKEHDLLYHIINTEPSPISAYNATVPEELCGLIAKCLNKKPKDRPKSVNEILDLIESFQLDLWTNQDARFWWNNHF